jgi:hypothetical protein
MLGIEVMLTKGWEMQGFLIALSGARREILDQCPTERVKFQSLGWAILITSTMATISMWFALTSALGVNPVIAVPAALVWGLIIMGIDRWLVTSIPTSGSRRWALAAPRLVLALLLGSIISTPLVLRVFQSEINAQISVIKEQRAAAYLDALQRGSVGSQVVTAQKRVTSLQKVIDSGGTVVPDPSTDPVVETLTKQQTAALALERKYYQQWQCQLYGGPTCPAKGNGVLAQASERSYNKATALVALLGQQIQRRENVLSANNATADKLRVSQARSQLPNAQLQLTIAQARLDQLRRNFDVTNQGTNGLLIRLQALSDLTGHDFTLGAARLLLFLLFLVIECLPVTVKLMQRPGNYDRILQVAAEREFKDARRHYRDRSRNLSAQFVGIDPAPRSGGSLRDIWQEPVLTTAFDRPDGGLAPEIEQETDEAVPYDDTSIRQIQDQRGNTIWSGSGIDLSWSDGER